MFRPDIRLAGLFADPEECSLFLQMSKRGPNPAFQSDSRTRLRELYDWMWLAAARRIRTGKIEPDPVLAARVPDIRRGLTVIARPSFDVRRKVMAFLGRLRGLEPDQHYYTASELHVTVLSLFTATVEHARFFAREREYVAAVDSALRNVPPVRVQFAGVTASPGAIMIQGFMENEALNEVRDALRRELTVRDLAEGVDGRYRLETAHMTVARFRAPLRDGDKFAKALEAARLRRFGAINIRSVSIVRNDWYMTSAVAETVKRRRLRRGGSF
jgi:2'-5' RNA ligase